jgi:hypothetical protein
MRCNAKVDGFRHRPPKKAEGEGPEGAGAGQRPEILEILEDTEGEK